jgi:branched-chain amino acid transport system substrate-binding protein
VQNQTAANALISKGVFGVIQESPVAFGGAKVLQQAGLPVTGGGYDGPEWGLQPYTNMFSITGPVDPHAPQYTGIPNFVKARGGKIVGAFGYSISPSSTASATGFIQASASVGLTKGYLNTSLPFGSVAVGPLALGLKSNNVDSIWMPLDANTNFAILTAAKQAGVLFKAAISATGYGQTLLDNAPILADANGTYFLTPGVPVELNTAGTKAFQAGLAKYAHFSGIPAFDSYEGWGGTDLMIKGLQLAGKNPTQAAFIKNLRKVTNYTGNGLFSPANLTTKAFGKAVPEICSYLVQLRGTKFVPTPSSGKPTCGRLVPNSNQL